MWLTFLLASLVSVQANPLIVNGKKVGNEKFSSAVRIALQNEKGEYIKSCSAVKIASNAILTAHHCTAGKIFAIHNDQNVITDVPQNQVFKDESYNSKPVRAISLSGCFKRFSREGQDLALVTFPHPILLNSASAKLRTSPPVPGEEVAVAGYGNINPRFRKEPDYAGLNNGTNKIEKLHPNGAIFLEGRRWNKKVPDGKDATPDSGDSGSPLFDKEGVVIGISSHGGCEILGKRIGIYEPLRLDQKDSFLSKTLAAAGISVDLK
jgi:hypothetical protein